jgi:outer membrane receptor protein involved in Fe transport
VPIAISVVSGEALQEANITKLEALAPTIPNFHHSESVSGNDQLFIRGVGSGVNFGFENSVGQVFDGIFFGRARYGRALFMDLERVEILKGPQGALIGKNTTAGAINITSAKPTREFEAYLLPTWEFEGDDGPSLEGAISGPLDERVRARVAFRYEDRDGYVDNLVRDEEEMAREEWGVRALLDADITENFTALLTYQYAEQTRMGRVNELAACTPMFDAVLAGFGDDCEFNYTNTRVLLQNGVEQDSATNTETHLGAITLNWDMPLGLVTSITGFSRYTTKDHWDSDNIAIEAASILVNETFEQWSEEIRLSSTGERTFDYIVGAYFSFINHETRFGLDFNFMGPPPLMNLPPPLRARDNRNTDQENDAAAGFAQVTWHVHPQWDLIAGIRFTHEQKDARHRKFTTQLYTDIPRPTPPAGPAANSHDVTGSIEENQWTPNGTIQWRPFEDAMLYANVGKGFKGGGFDHQLAGNQAFAEANFEFRDESVVAYEVGGKFQFPEYRVQANIAWYRSEFEDLQVSALLPGLFGATVFKVGNAASAISQGVEGDVRWRPLDQLMLSASAAYLDAEFDEYPDAPCYALQTVADGCINNLQDLSGQDLQFAPEWKFTIDGTYTWTLPNNMALRLFSRVYYQDDSALALDLDPKSYQDAFAKVDASLTLAAQDGRWRVAIVGQNLTDKLTANFANDGAGPDGASFFYFAQPPRSIAIQGRMEF